MLESVPRVPIDRTVLDLTARRPERAPLFAAIADGPEDGCAAWVRAADGVRLRAVHWGAGAPRGTVLVFAGRTEYAEKYGRVAADLGRRGYAAATIDWRGQGLSDRLRSDRALGHVERFGDYQQDVAALVAHAEASGLPRPWFLLAHSMGGCIGLRSLVDGLDVAAAAFSAPMWGIQMGTGLRPVAWTVSSVGRQLGLGHLLAPTQEAVTYVLRADFADNTLTTDREMFEWMRAQVAAEPALALGGPSLHWLNEALREMRRLAWERPPDVPTLAFLGTDERIVDPQRVRGRLAGWRGARLVTVPGARHELLMEAPAIRDRVMDAVDEHFAAHA